MLDEWYQGGQGFTFSHEPRRQGNNVLRWELDIAAGDDRDGPHEGRRLIRGRRRLGLTPGKTPPTRACA